MIGSKIRLKWAVNLRRKRSKIYQDETVTRLDSLFFVMYHFLSEKNCIALQANFLSDFGIFQNGERILRKTKPTAGK